MEMSLGENLRKLRLKNELTQEELAEIFNMSPQAISRWENSSAYPDITTLVGIANYYDVSLDELIGMEEIRKSESRNNIFSSVHQCRTGGMPDQAISMLRDAIRVYPNNYGLLSELALTLTMKSNNEAEPAVIDEAIALSECVLKNSTSEKKQKHDRCEPLLFVPEGEPTGKSHQFGPDTSAHLGMQRTAVAGNV